MRHILPILICFLSAAPALGRSAPSPEIRHIQTDSTDVFAVLTNLRRAEAALVQRDYTSARHGFESVLMHDPQLNPARSGLRRTLIAQGDFNSAKSLVEDWTSADAVIIRVLTQDVATPIELLTSKLKSEPDPRLWTLLGQLQDAQHEFSSARQSYAMAGLAGARAGLPDNNIGHSHWLASEYELALAAFNNAVAKDPLDTQFDNNRRRTLIRLGRTQDAISGLNAERAALFLGQAADKAIIDDEIKLARFLYRKSLEIAPRHNPLIAEKLARLR